MSPQQHTLAGRLTGVPRASGDEPREPMPWYGREKCSPRERG